MSCAARMTSCIQTQAQRTRIWTCPMTQVFSSAPLQSVRCAHTLLLLGNSRQLTVMPEFQRRCNSSRHPTLITLLQRTLATPAITRVRTPLTFRLAQTDTIPLRLISQQRRLLQRRSLLLPLLPLDSRIEVVYRLRVSVDLVLLDARRRVLLEMLSTSSVQSWMRA